MGLKNTRIARAENLPDSIQKDIGTAEGMVIIETRNPDLRESFKPIKEGGIREYLLSLGKFKKADITN